MKILASISVAIMRACTALILAACTGCPPPASSPPITIVEADGSVLVVSNDTACNAAAPLCGTTVPVCLQNIANLQGEAPIDLKCLTEATTPAQARGCVGSGVACQ